MNTTTRHSFRYSLDVTEKKIVITRAFEKAAMYPGSDGYKQLMGLIKAYKGYTITVESRHPASNKTTYKGLDYDEMQELIILWDGKNAVNLTVLESAKSNHVPFPKVKKWFVENYGDKYKALKDMPTAESANSESTTANNAACAMAEV